jgi:hypothetical protein
MNATGNKSNKRVETLFMIIIQKIVFTVLNPNFSWISKPSNPKIIKGRRISLNPNSQTIEQIDLLRKNKNTFVMDGESDGGEGESGESKSDESELCVSGERERERGKKSSKKKQ